MPVDFEIELRDKLKELTHSDVSISALRSTNNRVFLIEPLEVVAKVSTGNRKQSELELFVARSLESLGAPVGRPAVGVFDRMQQIGDFNVSFWEFYPNTETPEQITSERLADTLYELHRCCAQLELRAEFPSCFERLRAIEVLLEDKAALPKLADSDQHFLSELLRRLSSEAQELVHDKPFQLIHGEPHLHNILNVRGLPIFIDWESVCSGPLEWDLSYMKPEVVANYPIETSDQLVSVCRGLTSIAAATWCWRDYDIGDLREHAEFHLESLRVSYGKRN